MTASAVEDLAKTQIQQNQKKLKQLSARTKIIKSSFLSYCVKKWNNLCEEL